MKIYKTLFVIGILIVILPFIGLTSKMQMIFYVVIGTFLILMAISMKLKMIYLDHIEKELEGQENETFTENMSEENLANENMPEENKQNNFDEEISN